MFTSPHQRQRRQFLLCQLHQFQLKIAHLESVLAESVQNLTDKIDRIEEREKRIDDNAQKNHHLQSVLSTLTGDSLATEEEVRLLSRKYNFHLHVLESKAQDALRLKRSCTDLADIVTQQWIQIQRLEQALHNTQMRTMRVQRQLTRCTFLKFINNLSDDPLLKTLGPNFRSYFSRALHQFKRVFTEFKRSHHELNDTQPSLAMAEVMRVFVDEVCVGHCLQNLFVHNTHSNC